MKKLIVNSLFTIFALSIGLVSCKKDDTAPDLTVDQNNQLSMSDDQNSLGANSDGIMNDVNAITSSSKNITGRSAEVLSSSICNATVTDSSSANKSFTLTFNGLNCEGTATRTGSIKVQLIVGSKWDDVNSKYRITYNNVNIKRKSDGRSWTLGGNHTVTNVSGGSYYTHYMDQTPMVHTIHGTVTVLFDQLNQSRSWTVARRRTINISSNVTFKVENDSTVAEVGTNRFGKLYTANYTSPILGINCGTLQALNFKYSSGVVLYSADGRTATLTVGVKKDGSASTSCADLYGYKLDWTGLDNKAKTLIASY